MIDVDSINSILSEWFADCDSHLEVTQVYHMVASECDAQASFMHKELKGKKDGDT